MEEKESEAWRDIARERGTRGELSESEWSEVISSGE